MEDAPAKSDLIGWVLEREQLSADRVQMIGDRDADMTGALANGVAGIGVLWGFGSHAELDEAGARAIARSPRDLLRYAGAHGP